MKSPVARARFARDVSSGSPIGQQGTFGERALEYFAVEGGAGEVCGSSVVQVKIGVGRGRHALDGLFDPWIPDQSLFDLSLGGFGRLGQDQVDLVRELSHVVQQATDRGLALVYHDVERHGGVGLSDQDIFGDGRLVGHGDFSNAQ